MPPLVGVAVHITFVPAHIAPEGTAAMLTLAGKLGFTVIVIAFDVAGDPVEHKIEEVITNVIISLFESVVDVYVELLVPILLPLTFH